MTKPISVSQFAADLAFAAGTGATRVKTSVTARGSIAAKTSYTGPGLSSALARHASRASRAPSVDGVDPAQLPAIADRMATDALGQGARLLSGERR